MIRYLDITYLLLGALIMFLLMRGCSQPPEGKTEYIRGETITDTVYITQTKTINKPVPYEVLPAQIDTNPADTLLCDSVRLYRTGVDSGGVRIDVASTVRGALLSQTIDYRLQTIHSHRTDTLRVTTHRNYRYGVGLLYDGRRPIIFGQYGVSRNAFVAGGYRTDGTVMVGAGVRF